MQLQTLESPDAVTASPPHYQESWLQWFWRELRETANPNTMHTEGLTPVELEKQASFESFDYYKSYPDAYVEFLRESYQHRSYHVAQDSDAAPEPSLNGAGADLPATATRREDAAIPPHPRRANTAAERSAENGFAVLPIGREERHIALRWLLHVLIALSVGVVATVVSYAVDFLESYRADTLFRIMTESSNRFVGVIGGFLYTVFGSAVLISIAAGAVVFFELAASGGGIPDIMAYLNGVHLRKAMNLRTFVAKAISCVCAVAGGLPVGLEAPLIHLGAITGAGMTQGRSRTLGFQTSFFQSFRNHKDRRDFITAGAACGVSVAFGAPIGGLLFVMEEVSSFWDHSTSGQIFLATMLCFTFSTIINSIVEDRRLLGWVSNAAAVLFEVNLKIPLNLVAIVPSLFLGVIVGSLAAFFTKLNLMLIKWRRRVLRPHPWRRFLEPVILGVVFSTTMYVLAIFSSCAALHGIEYVNETVPVWGTEDAGRLFNNTCTRRNTYSPLGTLAMASGKNTIRHLFSRQTAGEFPAMTLAVYFVVYFGFACATSGTSVSGGLVVPSLVMGAVFGRLFGLVLFEIGVRPVPGVPRGYADADAWMDPGVFALIGAGAFLAGTSRMSMAICVIMVELSAELHYLLPVMVAIILSKSTADWLSEPLYHQMLHMDSVPYLPSNMVRPGFEQLTAADVMAPEVVTLRRRERTAVVLAALRDTTHHAFPVVEELVTLGDDRGKLSHRTAFSPNGAPASPEAAVSTRGRLKFLGLVTREDLQVYLTLPPLQDYVPPPTPAGTAAAVVPLSDKDSDGFGGRLTPCICAIRRLTWTQWMQQKNRFFFDTSDRFDWVRTHIPDYAPDGAPSSSSIREQRLPPVLDLSLIVNRSPWVIPPFFNLHMAYQTFRMMGLRHMVVVDGDAVVGIITRKDLLVDALQRKMKELRARLAAVDSATPSLPPVHTGRAVAGEGSLCSRTDGSRAEEGEKPAATRVVSGGAPLPSPDWTPRASAAPRGHVWSRESAGDANCPSRLELLSVSSSAASAGAAVPPKAFAAPSLQLLFGLPSPPSSSVSPPASDNAAAGATTAAAAMWLATDSALATTPPPAEMTTPLNTAVPSSPRPTAVGLPGDAAAAPQGTAGRVGDRQEKTGSGSGSVLVRGHALTASLGADVDDLFDLKALRPMRPQL